MSQTVLKIRNVTKTFPGGVQALRGISFDVKKGEFLAIIGLSGSGKSTLLRSLNRLHETNAGEIYYNDVDVAKLKSSKEIVRLRQKMAMIFQQFNLMPRHSVLTNVLMGRLSYTSTLKSLLGLFSKADKAQAMQNLKLVGLSEKAFIRADQLSGGQQQRVAIARALTQNPDVILADEPVASLDPATCHVVMDYLKKVNQELGITIICNLHFLSLVRQYATRVIALKDGVIIFEGDPENIDPALFEKIYGEGAADVQVH